MAGTKFTAALSKCLKEIGPELIIVALFVVSRTIFFLKGGAFLARPLLFAKQYLDPELLKNDLLTSLLYQHSQPPLFNFFLGTILKLSPVPAASYEFLFKTVGILIPLIFYGILILMGLKRLFALPATIVFMLNPTLILYENLLYYTYVETFLVLLSIFFLMRWGKANRFLDLFLFWTSMLCLGLVRSLFHPVFFLLITVLLAFCLRRAFKGQRASRPFLLCSSVVLIPLFALCLKNFCLFGFFGTSSWTGMSLWIKTNGYSPEELQTFYSQGIISSLALKAEFDPFQPIQNFYEGDKLKNIPCRHPADCEEWRSSGKPNFNHSGYVYLSKQLRQDALALIARNPGMFALYTAGSYSLTLWHSSDSVHALFQNNMLVLEKLERIYRFLYFGFLGVESKYADPGIWVRALVISGFFLFFYSVPVIQMFRKNSPIPPALTIVCLFCLLIHSYTLVVSSLIEFGENNRFRTPVDAAFLVIVAADIIIWKTLKAGRLGNKNTSTEQRRTCRET